MGKCKDCKWWEGACDFVETIHADADKETLFIIRATADDDQGLEAALLTGPEFGCIHFEGKEK